MNQYPTLKNATEALLDPEAHEQEIKAYQEAKRPAEELLKKQRKALDDYFRKK